MHIRHEGQVMNEYEGRDENVSRRTVQADIQMMRSDKLGYNAPIVVRQNRYYTYEDPEYSIVDVPLSSQDTELLSEALGILKQLSGFSALLGIEDIRGHGRVHHLPAGSHSQSRAGEGPSRLRVRNHSPSTAVTRRVHQETSQSIGESVRSLFRYCENNLPRAFREQTPHPVSSQGHNGQLYFNPRGHPTKPKNWKNKSFRYTKLNNSGTILLNIK